MTITAPRSTFKRSTERKVGEIQLRQWAFADARKEDRRLESFEEVGFSVGAASVLVSPASMDEVFGDDGLYDDFGVMR